MSPVDPESHKGACRVAMRRALNARANFFQQHPEACKKCGGWGYDEQWRQCPQCLGQGVCPRCGEGSADSIATGLGCLFCGYQTGSKAKGLPMIPKCTCPPPEPEPVPVKLPGYPG